MVIYSPNLRFFSVFGVVFPDSKRFTYFLRGGFVSVSTPFCPLVIKSSNAFLTEPSLMQFRSFSPSMFLQILTLSAEFDSKVFISFDTIFGELTCLDTRWRCCTDTFGLHFLERGDFGLFGLLNFISDLIGTLWNSMELYGPFWNFMELFWNFMEVHHNLWHFMKLYHTLWYFMTLYGF